MMRPAYNRQLVIRETVKMPTLLPVQTPSGSDSTVAAVVAKTGLAAIAGILSFFQGFTTQLFFCVLGLMFVDALLGVIAAVKAGEDLSANKFLHSLVKLLVYALGFVAAGLVALAVEEIGFIFGVDLGAVSYSLPWIALSIYAVNETASIAGHLKLLRNPVAGLLEGASETIGQVLEKRGGDDPRAERPPRKDPAVSLTAAEG